MTAAKIEVQDEPDDAHRGAILAGLAAFNAEVGFPGDARPVAVLLRGDEGAILGGLWGRTGYRWLFVEFLAVPAELRGQGLGAALMIEAECIGIERGCTGAWLTTFTFQARPFYEKLGYAVFGALEDSPAPGQARLLMQKRFPPAPGLRAVSPPRVSGSGGA
jgi:GNAT superfamily N-acetyltransferase